MRCASPAGQGLVCRESVKWPEAHATEVQLFSSWRRMSSHFGIRMPARARQANHAAAASDGQLVELVEVVPVTITNRAAGLGQLPWHVGRTSGTAVAAQQHAREFVAFGFQMVEILPDALHLFAAFPNEAVGPWG